MADPAEIQQEIASLQARLAELMQRQANFAVAADATAEVDAGALLGQVMDLVPHEIFAKDDQGNFVLSNRAHAASYELSPRDVVGSNERELSKVPSEAEKFLRDDLEIIRSGLPKFIAEEVFTDAAGAVHFLQTHKIPFQIAGSHRPGVLGVAVDITARKQVEQKLQASEERFRVMALNAPVGIATLDERGAMSYANPEFARIVGLTDETDPGAGWVQTLHPDDQDRVLQRWDEAVATQGTFGSEHRYGDTDDDVRWAKVHALPLRGVDDSVTGWLCLAVDITQQVETQSRLDEQQHLLAHVARVSTMGELATGLAHELNQPLAAISSYALAGEKLLQTRPDTDPEEIQELFRRTGEQAVRAGEIIKRLRTLVGKRTVVRHPIHVLEPVHEVLALFEASFRRSGIRVNLHCDEGAGEVLIDNVQVQQVLVNLIRNAVDVLRESAPQHRNLSVRVDVSPTHAQIAVADEGPGIDEAHVKQLFEPFFSTKQDGMGMGLAISRSIVEAHGGELWLHENAERGATFFFTLPRHSEEAAGLPLSDNQLTN